MIYEDIHKYLKLGVSAKEVDVVLELVNNVDWGSRVKVDEYLIAQKVGTTVRYLREIIDRISKGVRGKKILEKVGENEYIFLKGKSSILHSKADRYCQKYEFLYSEAFKGLSIYGKRIVLEGAMSFSLHNQRGAYLSIKKLLERDELGRGLVANRRILEDEVSYINTVFKGELCVGLTTVLQDKEEYLYIAASKGFIEDVRQSYIERYKVREILFKSGFAGILEERYSIELEKVGKHIFNYLVHNENVVGYEGDYFRDVVVIARELYEESLKKFAGNLQKLIDKGEGPQAVSAYFSSVVLSVLMEKTAKYKTQKSSIWGVLRRFIGKEREEEYNKRLKNLEVLENIFEGWVHHWVTVRVQKESGNWVVNKRGKERNKRIVTYIEGVVDMVRGKVPVNLEGSGVRWLSEFREQVGEYIGIQNKRIKEL